jgi:hypothetical protein
MAATRREDLVEFIERAVKRNPTEGTLRAAAERRRPARVLRRGTGTRRTLPALLAQARTRFWKPSSLVNGVQFIERTG